MCSTARSSGSVLLLLLFAPFLRAWPWRGSSARRRRPRERRRAGGQDGVLGSFVSFVVRCERGVERRQGGGVSRGGRKFQEIAIVTSHIGVGRKAQKTPQKLPPPRRRSAWPCAGWWLPYFGYFETPRVVVLDLAPAEPPTWRFLHSGRVSGSCNTTPGRFFCGECTLGAERPPKTTKSRRGTPNRDESRQIALGDSPGYTNLSSS